MSVKKSHVLLIGGTLQDPVAGVLRDAEILRALNVSYSVIVSELTTQGQETRGQTFSTPIAYFKSALELESERLRSSGNPPEPLIVKIGLLANLEQIDCLAAWLKAHRPFVIYDPVFESSRGLRFQGDASRQALLTRLFPYLSIVTPNSHELAWLAGETVTMEDFFASSKLRRLIVTGGHHLGSTTSVFDYVLGKMGSYTLRSTRYPGELRGSGCLFATALAAMLAEPASASFGDDRESLIDEAIVLAKCLTTSVWRTKKMSFAELKPEDFPECWLGISEGQA